MSNRFINICELIASARMEEDPHSVHQLLAAQYGLMFDGRCVACQAMQADLLSTSGPGRA
jgi:hypothetical protein